MKTRTCLVTGGTGGIGRAVAMRLARSGDRVLAVGRDIERGGAVLGELQAVAPGRNHRFLPADLSLLGETALLADRVAGFVEHIDALVLCAGEYSLRPAWTREGLEHTMALNFLSRFALITHLLPLLEAAAPSRVVLVAAAGQYGDLLDLEALAPGCAHPGRRLAGASQFANDLFAVELAERLSASRVDVSCVHPGITRTDVFRRARGVSFLVRSLAIGVQQLVGRSPDEAADTPAYLASDASPAGLTGRFFGPGRRDIPVPRRASDVTRRSELWRTAESVITEVAVRRSSEPSR